MSRPLGLTTQVRTPGGTVRLREGAPLDTRAFIELRNGIYREACYFITELDEAENSEERIEAFLESLQHARNGLFLVAESPYGGLVGTLLVQGGRLRRMRHVGRLEIYVARGWRGQGIGSALLGNALHWAGRCPALEKLSLAVFSNNRRAIRLYRRFGFEREGYRRDEYRMADGRYLDDVLMARSV